MKVAILCANGRAGALITGEAVSRGLDVTAFIRSGENRTAAPRTVRKDLFDLTAEDLKGYDVVVDAFGAWEGDAVDGIARAAEHLCDILSGSDARLLIVGGAGLSRLLPPRRARTRRGFGGAEKAQRRQVDLRQPRLRFPRGRTQDGTVSARRRGARSE